MKLFSRERSSSSAQKAPEGKVIPADDPSIAAAAATKKAAFVSAGFLEVPKALHTGEALTLIDLSFNKITTVPDAVLALPQLKKLSLVSNFISLISIAAIEKSGKKLATVELKGNPLAFPPLAIAEKGWSTVRKWAPANPSCVVYRLYYGEKDGKVSFTDIEYSAIRDPMVKTKDEDRDSSFVLVPGEAEERRLPTINRHEKSSREGWWGAQPKQAQNLVPIEHAYFGVYDGHCGNWVSQVLVTSLYKRFKERRVLTDEAVNYEQALVEIFMELDKLVCDKLREANMSDGSTCVTTSFDSRGQIVCAHVGDSRTSARIKGRDVELTVDHDPGVNKKEKERVEKRGGTVTFHKGSWRVNENLSVSRAFGDTNLKNSDPPFIDAIPEVSVHPPNPDVDWLVIMSDGLHHLMDNDDIIRFVAKKQTAEDATVALMSEIDTNTRSQIKGHDNATIIVLKLSYGRVPVEFKIKAPL